MARDEDTNDSATAGVPGGFEHVLRHVSDEILSGRYRSGDRLPAERTLAAAMGVSRGAVREAFKVLQAQGIVVAGSGPGHGTRIATTQGAAFGRMLRMHLALHSTSYDDLTETRIILERAASSRAAVVVSGGRHDPEVLGRARQLVDEMAEDLESHDFNELDTAFHVAVAELGDNNLVRDLTIAIRESVAATIRSAEEKLPDWPALRARLMRDHEEILAAIESGDGAEAARVAETHIRSAHDALLPLAEA